MCVYICIFICASLYVCVSTHFCFYKSYLFNCLSCRYLGCYLNLSCFICFVCILYVYICIYLSICIFLCVYIYEYFIYMYICMCVYVCVFICASLYVCVGTHFCLYESYLFNCLSCRYLGCYLSVWHCYLGSILAFSFEIVKFNTTTKSSTQAMKINLGNMNSFFSTLIINNSGCMYLFMRVNSD